MTSAIVNTVIFGCRNIIHIGEENDRVQDSSLWNTCIYREGRELEVRKRMNKLNTKIARLANKCVSKSSDLSIR